jgi:hypothetical protein
LQSGDFIVPQTLMVQRVEPQECADQQKRGDNSAPE